MKLEVRNIEFGYSHKRKILNNINFGMEKGNVLTILGPNGAGKSTLLNCIMGLLKPTSGEVLIDGVNRNELASCEVAKIIAYVPQTHIATYAYTVRDFVVMGRAAYLKMYQRPSEIDYQLVDEVLHELKIDKLADCDYTQISGGERQQVTIARAIVQQPDIIILDEPTSHLDFGNQFRMVKQVKKLSEKGFGIIMTTHTPDHAIILNSKIGILDEKGKFCVGSCEQLVESSKFSELYKSDVKIVFEDMVDRKICMIK